MPCAQHPRQPRLPAAERPGSDPRGPQDRHHDPLQRRCVVHQELARGLQLGRATAPYRRSPCPAINTLANHGYLARNGQNITRAGLKVVMMTHFNLDDGLATFLTGFVPETFDLDLLGKHNFIEHDASLVHADASFGGDPAFPDGALLEDFFSRASSSQPYTIQTLGEVRRDRLNECRQINPNCTFDAQSTFLAFGEAAFVVKLFGDGVSDTAPLANVRSFLANEKFPRSYHKPALLSQAALLNTSALIQAVANAKTPRLSNSVVGGNSAMRPRKNLLI